MLWVEGYNVYMASIILGIIGWILSFVIGGKIVTLVGFVLQLALIIWTFCSWITWMADPGLTYKNIIPWRQNFLQNYTVARVYQ
jgi:hypothetical protein